MGADGIFELDQECWLVLAKYNLALATLFAGLTLLARTLELGSDLLLVENGALAIIFGAIQTYAWLST